MIIGSELVEHWYAGPLTSNTSLLGLKLYWWARTGIVLQFMGVSLLILEVIGETRLSHLADKISKNLAGSTVANLARYWKAGREMGRYTERLASRGISAQEILKILEKDEVYRALDRESNDALKLIRWKSVLVYLLSFIVFFFVIFLFAPEFLKKPFIFLFVVAVNIPPFWPQLCLFVMRFMFIPMAGLLRRYTTIKASIAILVGLGYLFSFIAS